MGLVRGRGGGSAAAGWCIGRGGGKRCGGLVGDGGDGVSGWNGVAGVLRGEKGGALKERGGYECL